MKVGEFRIAPVCDGVFHLPMNSIATNAESAARKAYFDAQYMTADVFQLQVNPLLIDTAEKLVLVDTGVGPGQDWAPTAGRLAKSLQNAGVAPADIDVIVLTHCHVDHVGGLEAAVSEGFSRPRWYFQRPSSISGIRPMPPRRFRIGPHPACRRYRRRSRPSATGFAQ
ncbi:hypothetical protein AJ87_35175 [Rhizobium yanglingense]|nr:hypothetical protein AJ87_35175 [Rhizobium yanglingense]